MRINRLLVLFLSLILAAMSILSGCGGNREPQEGAFYLYYKDVSSMSLHPVEGFFDDDLGFEERVAAVFGKLRESGSHGSYRSAIPENIQILSATLLENNLVFDFNNSYHSMVSSEEVLMRAAVVKTFTQMKEVSTVEFHVEGQPLILSRGTIPGAMRSADFKDVFGSGLNAYTETRVVLYYCNETGDKLRRTVRELYYSNQISVEQFAVQQLIAGPNSAQEGLPVLPANLKVNFVTVRDGICHVDFGSDFLTQAMPLPAELIVFSIVDTLTEMSEVTGVRISVDSRSEVFFMDTVDLSQLLYRNLEFIETSQVQQSSESAAP